MVGRGHDSWPHKTDQAHVRSMHFDKIRMSGVHQTVIRGRITHHMRHLAKCLNRSEEHMVIKTFISQSYRLYIIASSPLRLHIRSHGLSIPSPSSSRTFPSLSTLHFLPSSPVIPNSDPL